MWRRLTRKQAQAHPEPLQLAQAHPEPLRLVLFIGHHKVGSTALQDFLSRNAVALMKAGILYPAVEAQGLAILLARAARGRDGTGGADGMGALPFNLREAHNALAFKMMAEHSGGTVPPFHKGLPHSAQMIRALRLQVTHLQPHTVILCSEVFANFAAISPDLIARLAGVFPKARVDILVTFRQIDEYLAAWHAQRLRFGDRLEPLSAGAAEGYFNTIHFDYRKMLEGWIAGIPEARVILRDYDSVLAAGGSVADFEAQTGLSLPHGLSQPDRTNPSIHRGLVEIARRGNIALPPPAARCVQGFLSKIGPQLDLPPSRAVEVFGADTRAQLLDRFAPIHDWLGAQAGQVPFFPKLAEARTPRPAAEAAVAARALEQIRARLAARGAAREETRGDMQVETRDETQGEAHSETLDDLLGDTPEAATARHFLDTLDLDQPCPP